MIQGTDGNFYGTGSGGRTFGRVYRITPTGAFTQLYTFGNSPDGSYPRGGLVEGSDGNFYGTTYYGGLGAGGTVFN